jgi:hypothetical protein
VDISDAFLVCRTSMLKTKRIRLSSDDSMRDLEEVAFSFHKMGEMVFRCPRLTIRMLRGSDWYRACCNRLQASEVVGHPSDAYL